MKGASIDTSNSSAFGSISDYHNAGNYEFNYIQAIIGNTIVLKYPLQRQYSIAGIIQVIRVPYYDDVIVSGTLSCSPWNGTTGGVLAFNVDGSRLAVAGPQNEVFTLETGSADRQANMRAFAKTALNLLLENLSK